MATPILPNRIRPLREQSKLTQKELGLLVGKHDTLIARQELGGRSLSHADILAYAKVFKCESYELFSEPVEDSGFPDQEEGIDWDGSTILGPFVPPYVQEFYDC